MIIIFMKCLYLPVYNSQPWVSHANFTEESTLTCRAFIHHEIIRNSIFSYFVFCLQMDIQSVLFVLRFVCGDYLPCYRNRCNLYFKLLHRSVLKKKLSFLAWKKIAGISNRHFFLADMNTPDDFDKKFVHRWVDRVFCYLPLGCQKVNRLQRYVSLHYVR